MAGYIEILIYMLCVYFLFKGVEIFQIAFVSTGQTRRLGMTIGLLAIVASVVAAGAFAGFTVYYSHEFSQRLQQPTLPPFQR